jgi:SAM-dependent methyltransferase
MLNQSFPAGAAGWVDEQARRLLGWLWAGALDVVRGRTAQGRGRGALLAAATTPRVEPCTAFGELDDEAWFEAIVAGSEQADGQAGLLPGLPDAEFQIGTVGSAGRTALREAYNFWKIVSRLAEKWHVGNRKNRTVLDFGCGWGRTMRFFLRDLPSANVWGLDVASDMIALCQQHFRVCRFELVPPTPPTSLPSASVDVAYSYSVFSHLNEAVANAWVEELARLLKPGGLLMVTTEPRSFIELCERIRRRGGAQNKWEDSLRQLFVDQRATLAAYDRGEFVHVPTGGGHDRPPSFYGESVIPRGYVERHWTRFFDPIEFRDNPRALLQSLIVMRKR